MGVEVIKRGSFAEFLNSPEQLATVTQRIEGMLFDSFKEDARKSRSREIQVSNSEMRRRFEILTNWFRVLRGDMGYSLQRTLDEMPMALRAELDGVPYVPNQRTMWASAPTTE